MSIKPCLISLFFLQILVKSDDFVTSDDEDYDVTGGSGDDEAWHSEVRQVRIKVYKNLKSLNGFKIF